MSNSTSWLRREWLGAGQKMARWTVIACVVGLGVLLIMSMLGLGDPALPVVTAESARVGAPVPTLSPVPLETPVLPTLRPTPSPTVFLSPTPSVPRIGVVAGHWWLDEDDQQSLDVGAVCDEGTADQLTEVEINLDVAERVVFELRAMGYQVDFLQEWDERLVGYQADVLVSVHADACLYPEATGFKVARVSDSHVPEIEDRLVTCLVEKYGQRTGLAFHEGSITHDMTRYHTFYEIDPNTPGAIIEVGFMLADRRILTQRPDLVAQGIIDGLLCFLQSQGRVLE
jgi:N-acetylmuramoyl-L-alanine amidase